MVNQKVTCETENLEMRIFFKKTYYYNPQYVVRNFLQTLLFLLLLLFTYIFFV